MTACTGALPPPPKLTVTTPARGLVQGSAGQVVVHGLAQPNVDGDRVVRVMVNDTRATLTNDGYFSATVDVGEGASLLQTVAYTDNGGMATDARAVQVGELRPVGQMVERAVTASLSTEAFAKLASVAGPMIETIDFGAMLAPMQPMADYGDDIANVKVSLSRLDFGNIRITLVPTDAGLAFSAEVDTIDVSAKAQYGGILVPDGTTTVGMRSDRITLTGTLVVTPVGTAGFTTTITAPRFVAAGLRLDASGLVGRIVDLLQSNLSRTVQNMMSKAVEKSLAPMINDAFGALAGPRQFAVLDQTLELEATPAAVQFKSTGALVTINLRTKIHGADSGEFIYTPNGTPAIDVGQGVQVGLSDDLVNGLLAQIHTLGKFNLRIEEDFGLVDTADFTLAMPPMVSANNEDGTLRLVVGDMIATFSKQGKTVIAAAVNAQIDLQVLRGTTAEQIALQFGTIKVWVNVLDNSDGEWELSGAATEGVGAQLDSLEPFLVNVPLPTVAGVTLDNLAMHADSGYVMMTGDIH